MEWNGLMEVQRKSLKVRIANMLERLSSYTYNKSRQFLMPLYILTHRQPDLQLRIFI